MTQSTITAAPQQDVTTSLSEYPPKADLRAVISRPLPSIKPGLIDPSSITSDEAGVHAQAALSALTEGLLAQDLEDLVKIFFPEQAFWRDTIAFTTHIRTFSGARVAATALQDLARVRGLGKGFTIEGQPQLIVISSSLVFIDCEISFQTQTPGQACMGRLILLPTKPEGYDKPVWKIWILSTWVEGLIKHPENEDLLRSPGRDLSGAETINTDVCILGAGSAGLMAAASLKALGIESVILDRNAQAGDSWRNRYDSLRLHTPTSSAAMPFKGYREDQQTPHLLTKDEIADCLREYAEEFRLNIIASAAIQSTTFHPAQGQWTVTFETGDNGAIRTIISKHFIQATGLNSARPYVPLIPHSHLYKGLSIHSADYRNTSEFTKQGFKTAAVIGSANTAFDVVEDCHAAGLCTTMVERSPTYILPLDHILHPQAFGCYDQAHPNIITADRSTHSLPTHISAHFSQDFLAYLAAQGPDRYKPLRDAGFHTIPPTDASNGLLYHLIEYGGRHYVDIGGTSLIANKQVAVRSLVEPVSYTATGLRLSDDSTLDADVIIWCTGFRDLNIRETAIAETFGYRGGEGESEQDVQGEHLFEQNVVNGQEGTEEVLGPRDIAARVDATYGADAEGEIRGMGKQHKHMRNYWVLGGGFHYQRWWSRLIAHQIRLELDGELPEAYRETPQVE
ncbi:FAD/NAD(P)-binding domain-containing protein [Sporormia fimetaria CBS 119925]|uniref:FAD/NAD(P)-binding domain-containing protein n=1 Tax=Sporormia fimetaria CBS 119925 TaxID=1340428 RepID=A0A6A6V620_9PLEO|nr:FAD/NAD(P)-binding domain-containing protein [Sporormia fimetaria CBS 119925]